MFPPPIPQVQKQTAEDLGAGPAIQFGIGECFLGAILVASTDRGICAILFATDADKLVRDLQERFTDSLLICGNKEFDQVVGKVVGFVEAPQVGLDIPLDVRGTDFQQRVWKVLCQVPMGETASYSDIADRIGSPQAVRAVARACASNTIAVAIPCHRVVRRDGRISGYRWGVERKRALLDREAAF